MNNLHVRQINEAIQSFVDATSESILFERIGTTAITLTGATDGELFLYNKNSLKKVFSSNKKVTLHKKDATKLFSTETSSINTITQKTLRGEQFAKMQDEVQSVIHVPLLYKEKMKPLGFILLYFVNDKRRLTAEEEDMLTLYSHTAALALTKAQLQEQSQRALEIRDRFISIASHELRTPLTAIHGYIQLLHKRTKGQETIEAGWINELFIESTRMTQLVKELLDVNRIKQGQFAFVFSEVPLLEVVTRAIKRHKLTDTTHPFEFQSQLSHQEIKVVGDFDKLIEMVTGLLGNAVKFSKPGEKITVTIKDSSKLVTLIVKDKGRGISKSDLNAIFNGFYKPEQASHIEGMGAGLLLARHIVDNHRGKLQIRSKENKGTTVTVTLPIIHN